MLGTRGDPYLPAGAWQLNFGYRYQKSDRHFVGDSEQEEFEEDGTEVVNNIHLFDLGLTYAITKRFSASLGLPVISATRDVPIRGPFGDVVGHDTQRANGIGDMMVSGAMWLFDPETFFGGNIQLSLGVKLPTGDPDVRYTATVRQGADYVREERTVDQSITPGDGSFGFTVGLQSFYLIFERYTLFAQGVYLFNPREKNHTPTFRTFPGEEVMSVTDAYLAKAGVATPIPWLGEYGFSCSLAGRIEGVPVRDIIGDDGGFRRPGYSISVEPGIAWSWRGHTLGLSAPLAVYRNRQQSVPEKQSTPERHGDAAFADYLILFSYSYTFGGGSGSGTGGAGGASAAECPPETPTASPIDILPPPTAR